MMMITRSTVEIMINCQSSSYNFSQVNLPGSNLLVKANLNLQFLNYWQLLKQQTDVTKIPIDGLDNEIEYDYISIIVKSYSGLYKKILVDFN